MAEGQIRPAIIVVICPGQATADPSLAKISACLGRYISEATSSVSRKELGLLGVRLADLVAIAVDMPVGHGNVEPAVEIGIKAHGAKSKTVDTGWTKARRVAPLLKVEPSLIAKEDAACEVEIGNQNRRAAGTVQVPSFDAHPRHHAGPRPQSTAAHQGSLHKPALPLVVEQIGGLQVIGHINVEPTVAVQVGHDDSQARSSWNRSDPGNGADIGKGPVAVVAIQLMGHLREDGRRTVMPHLDLGLLACLVVVEVHFDIVADVQIEI